MRSNARARGRDSAAGSGALSFLMLMVVFIFLFLPAAFPPPAPHESLPNPGRNRMMQNLRDVLDVGQLLTADDPSAPSLIYDLAWRGWGAGRDDLFWRGIKDYTLTPEALKVTFSEQRVSFDGRTVQHVNIFRPLEPDGENVWASRPTRLAERGPAHVVVPLEKVAGTASVDVSVVPLHQFGSYRTGLSDEHSTWARTSLNYSRSSTNNELDLELEREAWNEMSGLYFPAMDVHFEERDWQDPDQEEDPPTFFTLVLTQEDLAAERALAPEPEAEAYPQHRFKLAVSLLGPGQVAGASRSEELEEGEEITREAVRLEMRIPRQWTDVEFTQEDSEANDQQGWLADSLSAKLDKNGEWLVTGILAVPGSYRDSVDETNPRPGLVIAEEERIDKVFFVHGRPPTLAESADVGFFTIRATVQSLLAEVRQDSVLVVELATNPGRVHRSLAALAPSIVPTTPASDLGAPLGVTVPVGFVLANGAEIATLNFARWKFPAGTLIDARPAFPAILGGLPGTWTVNADTDVVTWEPAPLPAPATTCPALDACWAAATIKIDGAALSKAASWPSPEALVLYREQDVAHFVDAFVRSGNGHEQAPYMPGMLGGLAMATRAHAPGPGPARGAFTWTLPPSDDALCTDEDRAERDRWRGEGGDGKTRHDWGPRENGYPFVGTVADGCALPDADLSERFPVLGLAGSTRETARGVRAVGKTFYEAPTGVPVESFVSWRNGVAESSVRGPDEARVGTRPVFKVQIDALVDALTAAGVASATLTLKVIDPANAWEGKAWYRHVLVDDEPLGPLGGGPTPCGPPPDPCGDALGGTYTVRVRFPEGAPTGTHLVVAEVSWTFLDLDGASVSQVARVFRPVDVLLPLTPGEEDADPRALPGNVEMLGWLPDWEVPA